MCAPPPAKSKKSSGADGSQPMCGRGGTLELAGHVLVGECDHSPPSSVIGPSRHCQTRLQHPHPRWLSRIHLTRPPYCPPWLSRFCQTRHCPGHRSCLGIYECNSPEVLLHLGPKLAPQQIRQGFLLLSIGWSSSPDSSFASLPSIGRGGGSGPSSTLPPLVTEVAVAAAPACLPSSWRGGGCWGCAGLLGPSCPPRDRLGDGRGPWLALGCWALEAAC